MKKLPSLLLLLSMAISPYAHAEDPIVDDTIYYTDEDDQLFNRGMFVGAENDDYLKAARRTRNKNWAIAIGSTALGIVTVILVGNNHNQ